MSLFLNALYGKNFSRPPIWLMRQAGRYMPQYIEIKKKYGSQAMFQESDLIVKTTLLPMELLNVDAAIMFADILTVLGGLGKTWQLIEDIGPVIEPVKHPSDLQSCEPKEAYQHIEQALFELKKILKSPLIGFGGGPLTIAAYLIEGKLSKDLQKLKYWIYGNPLQLHALLDKITEATIEYLKLQIRSGVDALQIFDSWAGCLSPSAFQEFSLFYLKKVIKALSPENVPIILFCRGSCTYVDTLTQLNPQALSFDWMGNMETMSIKVPSHIALQGNLDPCILFGSQESIAKEVKGLLERMHKSPRYIFNLGSGILPQTPFDNVKFLVDCVTQSL